MKKLCLLLPIVTTVLNAYSQVGNQQGKNYIEGRVVSSVNNKPLENVPVLLKNSTIGTVTSRSGYFLIQDIPQGGQYRVVADYFGYFTTDTLINLTAGPVTGLTITLDAQCSHNRSKAEIDIEKGEAKLLLVGSIAPIYYPNQHKFERRYKVKYLDFGCTPPAYECIEEYNKRIFEYLDSKYGSKWREEVRQDVKYLNGEE